MTEVTAIPARDIGPDDFADIVPDAKTVTVEWADDGTLRVTFDTDLTRAQVAAVRRRICSATAEVETLREAAEGIATSTRQPTLAELAEQTRVLTRLVLAQRGGDGARTT